MNERDALLREYRDLGEQADAHWDEYQETGSSKAFGAYCAANRALSPVFMDLVVEHGMSLEDIREECAKLPR
jgi:hypothetical protein